VQVPVNGELALVGAREDLVQFLFVGFFMTVVATMLARELGMWSIGGRTAAERTFFFYFDGVGGVLLVAMSLLVLRSAVRRDSYIVLDPVGVRVHRSRKEFHTSWEDVASRVPPSYRVGKRRRSRGSWLATAVDDDNFRVLLAYFAYYPASRRIIAEPGCEAKLREVLAWYRRWGMPSAAAARWGPAADDGSP
jgi:hypothetical protein